MSTEHLSTPARQARLEQVEALLHALRGGEVDAIVGESQVLLLRHVQHTEAALHASEARFQALVEASAQIVWSTDVDGAVVDDSLSWRAFTGQTYEEWQGWGWLDALHPEDRARTAALWRQAVADQNPRQHGISPAPRQRRVALDSRPGRAAAHRRRRGPRVGRDEYRHHRAEAGGGRARAARGHC